MCNKYGVDIRLNTEADEKTIIDLNPDEVILATGGVPIESPIPINDATTVQAIDVLEGKAPLGNNVVVIGGGLIGVETAEFLISQNRKVTIVEMEKEVGADMHATVRYFAMKKLAEHNVRILTETKVKEISSKGITCTGPEGNIELKGFDMIILALGTKAYNPLEEKLKDKVKSLHVIGDAVEARKAVQAIEEATVLSLAI